jgi:hypothetical protein
MDGLAATFKEWRLASRSKSFTPRPHKKGFMTQGLEGYLPSITRKTKDIREKSRVGVDSFNFQVDMS